MKNRHGFFSLGAAVAAGGTSLAVDMSPYTKGIIHFDTNGALSALVVQGSPDGGTTWFNLQTLTPGNGNNSYPITVMPGLLRLLNNDATDDVEVAVVEGIREVA
jgi:hypothetical protein